MIGAAEGAAAAAAAAPSALGVKFASAWSSIKKAAAAGASAASTAVVASDAADGSGASALGDAVRGRQYIAGRRPSGDKAASAEGSAAATMPPAIRDRPGNWRATADLSALPRCPRKDVCAAGANWPCIAVVVTCPEQFAAGQGTVGDNIVWEGCMSLLAIVGHRLVCADGGSSKEVAIFAEFEIARILKVTSKKQAPDVLIFYFRKDDALAVESRPPDDAARDPGMVLHFLNGPNDVKAFIQTLKGTYTELSPAPQGG